MKFKKSVYLQTNFNFFFIFLVKNRSKSHIHYTAIFIKKLLAGESPVVFGDGLQTRDYVFVGDVVSANYLALNASQGGTYNVGTGVETSVNTLLARLQDLLQTHVVAEHVDKRPGDVFRSALSYDKICAELGWNPEVDLYKGLQLTINWFNSRI